MTTLCPSEDPVISSQRFLLEGPRDAILHLARSIRDESFGNRITYSPKVFIPLTMLCQDRCGYCTFAKAPAHVDDPYLDIDEVLDIARRGDANGCHEALFTLGERPEHRYASASRWLDDHGHGSTVEYLAAACRAVLDETGLLPHANAGALSADELALLRPGAASQGMMLESLNGELACHRGSPDKHPVRRIATIEAAGRLSIPFTTGVLVGIGESRQDILDSLAAIADLHRRYGHIQEVIVQNFLPKPGTAMRRVPPCDPDLHAWAIAAARILLPSDVHIQAPPNLTSRFGTLIDAGIDDFGGISPVTTDHVNPERPWPLVASLTRASNRRGFELVPRLTLYPEFARAGTWLDHSLAHAVMARRDAEGLAREDAWVSGGSARPPRLVATGTEVAAQHGRPPGGISKRGSSPDGSQSANITEVLSGASAGQSVGLDEIVVLFSARGRDVRRIAEFADDLRANATGRRITWVANRNINYTNICTFKCRFCAFSKGPLSLNLRGSPYLLTLDDIAARVTEAVDAGCTEVCLQGGIHPDFDGEYYVDVVRAVRDAAPEIHIHGFTALEVHEGARRLGEPLESYLIRLRDAGLRTLPGTAAEILDDEIRSVLCPDKVNTEQWLEVHRCAHRVGLRSNVTIMFGSVESPVSWARHILRTRDLQRESGGFTEFVPLPFVHMAAPIYLQGRARRGPTFREALLMHAIGRIAYAGHIDNIQVSWVKMGADGARQALLAGANDLGGILMDENISRAAGAEHGQRMSQSGFASIVEGLDRDLVQRSTLYEEVVPTT